MTTSSILQRCLVGAATSLAAAAAFAGDTPVTVPEPGTWALVGLAAAIGLIVSRNRRK